MDLYLQVVESMRLETISHIINVGGFVKITEKKLWLIEVVDSISCEIVCNVKSIDEDTLVLNGTWRGLIALDTMLLKIVKGKLRYYEIDLMRLAKLQVFIDCSSDKLEAGHIREFNGISLSKEIRTTSPSDMESWLLQQAMRADNDSDPIVNFLRQTECYNLVNFLLSATNDNNQCLQNLCVRYGLSAAHFRRLSRHALGHTTKVTLREWRMTKAILAFIDEPKNMTDIAFAHGYSSLSHFSNDVKKMLGMTPRALRKSILDVVMK